MLFKGKDLIIKNYSNGVILAASKSIELSVSCEMIETARSSSVWRKYITGRKDWSATVSTLVTSSALKSIPDMLGKTYGLYFHDGQSSTTALISGDAICKSIKITEQKGSIAKGSFVFQGTGALT